MAYTVALTPGDGIGTEVVTAAGPLLDDMAERDGFEIDYPEFDWGSERYLQAGSMMSDDGVDQLRKFDAILLGAVVHPVIPDYVTLRGLILPIRRGTETVVREAFDVVVDEQLADDSPPRTPGLRGDAGIDDVAMDLRARS